MTGQFHLAAQGTLGIVTFFLIAWLMSENRQKVSKKSVSLALFAQIVLAFLTLKVPAVRECILIVSEGISTLKAATLAGTSFVFGYVGGGELPFDVKQGGNPFIFAFQPLPMIIVVSALSMLLFHWGVLQFVVRGFSFIFRRTLNIGGALGVCAAAKVFLGQTDAPLLIRPYLKNLSRGELFSVMAMGMATTSATIMLLYASLLEGIVANPISHILTASVISVPAAIALSRMIVPHDEKVTDGTMIMPYDFSGSMDAISTGASDGMKLFLSIIAMLLVALALVSLANSVLSGIVTLIVMGYEQLPNMFGLSSEALVSFKSITLQDIFGQLLRPFAWLMGIPWQESSHAAQLLGTKTVLNEVMAFIGLSELPKGALSERSSIMMTYALCGFANFSSIGILIGGLGGMAPERRPDIISLGFKALIAGTMASCLSATVVGIFIALF